MLRSPVKLFALLLALVVVGVPLLGSGVVTQSGPRYYAPASSSSSSSSGGAVDDGSFTFTSTVNAGSPSFQQKFLGGKNGPLDTGTNNADFFGSGLDTGFAHSGGTDGLGNISPRFITAHANIRKNALDFDAAFHKSVNPANSAAFGMGYDTGSAISEVYVAYHIVWTSNSSVNLSTLQNKQVRFTTINTVTDNSDGNNYPFVMTSKWKNPPNVAYLAVTKSDPGTTQTTYYFDANGDNSDYPAFNTGIRYFVEQWFKPSTTTNGTDGAFKIKVTRTDTGVVVTNHSFTGINNYDSANRIRWLVFQLYFGNATPLAAPAGTANGTTNFEEPGDGRDSLEDIFIQVGTGANRQLIACDASTWSACHDRRTQVGTFSGTTRTIPHLNLAGGTFTYICELDDTGTIVNNNCTLITDLTPANSDFFAEDLQRVA